MEQGQANPHLAYVLGNSIIPLINGILELEEVQLINREGIKEFF